MFHCPQCHRDRNQCCYRCNPRGDIAAPIKHTRYVRYVGVLHPNGSVTLMWLNRLEVRSLTYDRSQTRTLMSDPQIHWLVDLSV